jgi:DNA-binding NtrC family response regulator
MAASTPARVPIAKSVLIAFANGQPHSDFKSLEGKGIRATAVRSATELEELLRGEAKFDGVVIEFDARDPAQRLQWLHQLAKEFSPLPFLAAVPPADLSLRAEVVRCGAADVVAAPISSPSLDRVLFRRFFPAEASTSRVSRRSLGPLIGASEPMQNLYDTILRIANSTATVLIRGESGTGKELVARTIVALSPRRDKPFVRLNCAALPESLIESELFGSEKGAYTGAVATRPGHIERADGGTLFLDEIATLPISLQTKLLRVIEDRAVQKLGSNTAKTIDFRLLTATNEPLEQMVKAGKFREDLYYRIHVMPIKVPALRERPEDIAILANHFLQIHCAAHSLTVKRLDMEALEVLEDCQWSGNIRELENLIQRLVLMVEGPTISVEHLPEQILADSTARKESMLIPPEGIEFDREMERIEVAYLQAALRRTHGKKTAAAQLLHIDSQRMKYLCRKYHLGQSADDKNGENLTASETEN